MSGRIHVLDDALADQIAAGEVVERPASVIKELLENAIDSGARNVTVEVHGGGTSLMRVTDDGSGMTEGDARLCIRRHATSKLSRAEDLHAIRSLGFRGEALPSIASVSRFRLRTRPREATAGTLVTVEGGTAPHVKETGCAPGTCVEVEDLFYNVPARRKFLKSRGTESAHISDACLRVALAWPQLRLVLMREDRRAREYLPVSGLAERVARAFPHEALREATGERGGVRLTAMLSAPERARSGAGGLHLFVNQRPVRSASLARSIAFAYGSVLPPGRYPVGAVYLELAPEEVDVNVHPQKAEVRFARGRAVLDDVTRMLAAALGTTAWGRAASETHPEWESRFSSRPPRAMPAPPAPAGDAVATATGVATDGFVPALGAAPEAMAGASQVAEAMRQRGESAAGIDDRPHAGMAAAPGAPTLFAAKGFFGSLRLLAQVRRMLLVCEGRDGLYVLDQHAADERVRFDRLRRAYRAADVKTQRLLFPERVTCSASETAAVDEHADELAAVGMECRVLGPQTVAVHTVPALLARAPAERLLRDVLDELGRSGGRAFGDAVDMALATMACHGAIRAGDALSPEEGAALLRSMDEVEDFAGHCPHGRPVVYSIGFDTLERRLGR